MNRSFLILLGLAAVAGTGIAHGTVISRDWKTPGDGLLTYDDVNKREWLDLTQSRLSMFAGSGFEQRYQNALLRLGPGGTLQGFAAANRGELISFAQSAGVNTTTDDFNANQDPIGDLISLVSISYGPSVNQSIGSFGLLAQLSESPQTPVNQRLLGALFSFPASGSSGQAYVYSAPGTADNLAHVDNTGIWLHRPVPEPQTIAISLLAIILAFVWEREKGTGPYI